MYRVQSMGCSVGVQCMGLQCRGYSVWVTVYGLQCRGFKVKSVKVKS